MLTFDCNVDYINYVFFTGRQFFQAEEVLYSARHASYEESLEAGIQCFLLSIEVSVGAVFQYDTVLLLKYHPAQQPFLKLIKYKHSSIQLTNKFNSLEVFVLHYGYL